MFRNNIKFTFYTGNNSDYKSVTALKKPCKTRTKNTSTTCSKSGRNNDIKSRIIYMSYSRSNVGIQYATGQ